MQDKSPRPFQQAKRALRQTETPPRTSLWMFQQPISFSICFPANRIGLKMPLQLPLLPPRFARNSNPLNQIRQGIKKVIGGPRHATCANYDERVSRFLAKVGKHRDQRPEATRYQVLGTRTEPLLREEVVKRLHRGKFVVLDIENGIELGDVKHILHFLAQR